MSPEFLPPDAGPPLRKIPPEPSGWRNPSEVFAGAIFLVIAVAAALLVLHVCGVV